jgi:putative ABC transport system permease protein
VPARALGATPGAGFGYVWASGPPSQVERALERSNLAPSYLTRATDVSRSADVTTVTKTYGLLRVVAIAFALIALVGLVLYLNARARSQLVSSEFMRRMGLPERAQAASVSLEAALLVAFSTAVGLGSALATSGLIVDRLDPLPQYAPSATTDVPWGGLLGAAAAVVVAAAVLGALVSIAVRRDRIGEALRVA